MDELGAFELRLTMPSGGTERIQVTTTRREAAAPGPAAASAETPPWSADGQCLPRLAQGGPMTSARPDPTPPTPLDPAAQKP
jgi:hypothetical protein